MGRRHTQKRRAGRLRGWVRPREDHSLNLTTDDSTSRRRRRRDRGDWHVVPREQTERESEGDWRANVRGTRKNEEGREGGSGRRRDRAAAGDRATAVAGRADPNDEGNAEKERERGRNEGGREGRRAGSGRATMTNESPTPILLRPSSPTPLPSSFLLSHFPHRRRARPGPILPPSLHPLREAFLQTQKVDIKNRAPPSPRWGPGGYRRQVTLLQTISHNP